MTTVATTVAEELQEYISHLNAEEQQSLLHLIKTFLQGREQTERIGVEQYNQEIEIALGEVDRGETYSHEEVVKMAKGW